MFIRLLLYLLLGSSALGVSHFTSGATIELVVPGYDYPGAGANTTLARGISNKGAVVGTVNHPRVNVASYERQANGQFSPPILFPGSIQTTAWSVNAAGAVCGTFFTTADHGFFYAGHSFVQYDVPGAVHTDVTGINDAGDFCGFYFVDASVIIPFVNTNGTLMPFTLPGVDEVLPMKLNNLGQIVGYYFDPADSSVQNGFFRDVDGTLAYPLDYPGSRYTVILGINDEGLLSGAWGDPSFFDHAFLLQLPGHFVSYDYPNGFSTTFSGINNLRLISGYYQDSTTFEYHSFIARVAR